MTWELSEAVSYYKKQGAPGDQSALLELLREIQAENGGVPRGILPEAARLLGVKESFLLAVIRRQPRLRLTDTHTPDPTAKSTQNWQPWRSGSVLEEAIFS